MKKAVDFLVSDELSHEDRLQLVLREEFLSPRVLREVRAALIERVTKREKAGTGMPCPSLWSAFEMARARERGEVTAAAAAAVRDAAWIAASDAAFGAHRRQARIAAGAPIGDPIWTSESRAQCGIVSQIVHRDEGLE